ncbi:pantoate--beta-alanine ligase [Fulvivirgaceae bacterium BMA12]|uniref:Pantothenate synthetase n=1 Tax=Agaribacillus aureus TaxID=3051825 RepID=A0ABT8LEE9_9BACT|nr:pantoate--beta-alanine ligase [Fulvivirgaceae bacterium BMA12]
MEVFKEINALRQALNHSRSKSLKIGLVPTMGALHEGHASLINQSINETDITVCSLFVNPIQFNNPDDLNTYPRDLERDIDFLEKLGCHILFHPSTAEMYPQPSVVKFSFGSLEQSMEGAFREGHFGGVALVVSKLLNIVKPDKAYFGQKDLQQYIIIQKIVQDLNIDVDLVCAPIIREESGLAISSRNERLTQPQRDVAANLYKALQLGRELLMNNHDISSIKQEISHFLAQWPDICLEYFEVVSQSTLEKIDNTKSMDDVALCIAAYVGSVRLIDNIIYQK